MLTHLQLAVVCSYLAGGLAMPTDPLTSTTQVFHWQQRRDSQEPILRFPFAQYLANPCGIGPAQGHVTVQLIHRPEVNDTEEQTILRPLSDTDSLLVQSEKFVAEFRDRYPPHQNITDTERQVIDRELHLVYQETRHLMGQIYSTTAVPNCRGIQLRSLGPAPSPIVSISGDIEGIALYRELLIAAAHFHLMVRDIVDSGRYCLHESFVQRQLVHLLTGKLESMVCLILQSGFTSTDRLFAETIRMLPSNVYRYTDCPSRQIRSCLVLDYTTQILDSLDHFFANNSRRIETSDIFHYNFLRDESSPNSS